MFLLLAFAMWLTLNVGLAGAAVLLGRDPERGAGTTAMSGSSGVTTGA